MMIEIQTENVKMNIVNYIGCGFRGVRNDGRVFVGVIQDARPVKDRTLVIIRQADDAHKSFYIEDITGGWSASLVNGQPLLLNQ
jgi:hypothetical protein